MGKYDLLYGEEEEKQASPASTPSPYAGLYEGDSAPALEAYKSKYSGLYEERAPAPAAAPPPKVEPSPEPPTWPPQELEQAEGQAAIEGAPRTSAEFHPILDATRRFGVGTASTVIKAAEGAIRLIPYGTAGVGGMLVPQQTVNLVADAFARKAEEVQKMPELDPALEDTGLAKVAEAGGSFVGTLPAAVTSMPLVVGQAAAASYADHYDTARKEGKGEAEAKREAVIGLVKTFPELGGYLVAGKAGALGAKKALQAMGQELSPVLQGILGGAFALPANIAASSTIRKIEGQPAAPFDPGHLATDTLWAIFHGKGVAKTGPREALGRKFREESEQMRGAAAEELVNRGYDPTMFDPENPPLIVEREVLPPALEQPTGVTADASQNRLRETPGTEEILVPEVDQGGGARPGVLPEGRGQEPAPAGGAGAPGAPETIPETGAGGETTTRAPGAGTGGGPAAEELRPAQAQDRPADQRAAAGDERAEGPEGAERAGAAVAETPEQIHERDGPIAGPRLVERNEAGEVTNVLAEGPVGETHEGLKKRLTEEWKQAEDSGTREEADAALDRLNRALEAEHAFGDEAGNTLAREEAGPRAFHHGQAPNADPLQSQNLRPAPPRAAPPAPAAEPAPAPAPEATTPAGEPIMSPGPGAASVREPLASYEERAFGKKLQETERLDPQLREEIADRFYERKPNAVTEAEAIDFIRRNGIEQSIRDIQDLTKPIEGDVRVNTGIAIIEHLNELIRAGKKANRPDQVRNARARAVDVAEWLERFGTQSGRTVNAFGAWGRLDPASKLMSFQRSVRNAVASYTRSNRAEVAAVKDAVAGVKVRAGDVAAKSAKVARALRRDASKILERETIAGRPLKGTIDQVTGVAARSRSLWNRYREGAISSLAGKLIPKPGEARGRGQPAGLSEFTRRLTANLRSRLPEPAPGAPAYTREARLTDEQVLREAYTNFEKYQDVWEQTQKEVQARLKDHPEALESLDDYFGAILERPFSPRTIQKLVKQEMKDRAVNLAQLVRQHYSVGEGVREDLAASISGRMGLSEAHAREVASAVKEEFEREMLKAKSKGLKALVPRNRVARKIDQRAFGKLLDASNLGALSDEVFFTHTSERLGLPKYSEEVGSKIMELAENVQQAPEGIPRDKATKALADYMARQMGSDARHLPLGIYYANILSGYNTQLVNFVDTALNVVNEVNNLALLNPRASSAIYSSLLRGVLNGRYDALYAFQTGRRITAGGKYHEGDANFLELQRFGEKGGTTFKTTATGKLATPKEMVLRMVKRAVESKPLYILNGAKYVGRIMNASDALMFRGAEEARSGLLAWRVANETGAKGEAARKEARHVLALDRMADFREQAKSEGFVPVRSKGVGRLRDVIRETNVAFEARVTELMNQARPEGLRTDAQEFAGIATYNHTPSGTIGIVANGVANLSNKVIVIKPFVPFTRVVANVTNRGLDNTPWGYKRALLGRGFGRHGQEVTGEQKQLLLMRASIGTAAMTGMGVLSSLGYITLHGAGPSDPEKRKQLVAQGWKPFSVQFGNEYVSYIYSPAGLGLAMVGNWQDKDRYDEFKRSDPATKLAYTLLSVPSTVFSQSFLSGMSSLFDVLSAQPSQVVSGLKRVLPSTIAGFVAPNWVTDLTRIAWDPYARTGVGIAEDMVRNIPVLRTVANPTLNAFGEPIILPKNRFFSHRTSDPAWAIIAEKGLRVPVPDINAPYSDGHIMTKQESYLFQLTAGAALKEQVLANLKTLRKLDNETAQERLSAWSRNITPRVRRQVYQPDYSGIPTKG